MGVVINALGMLLIYLVRITMIIVLLPLCLYIGARRIIKKPNK